MAARPCWIAASLRSRTGTADLKEGRLAKDERLHAQWHHVEVSFFSRSNKCTCWSFFFFFQIYEQYNDLLF